MTHIAELVFDPNNARQHNPRNIGMIAESLQKFGANRSITIDEGNVILAGNGVVEAAMQIGVEHVRVYDQASGALEPEPPGGVPYLLAVRVSGLTPQQKALYALADNRTAELSTWKPEVLAALKTEVPLDTLWFDDELFRILHKPDANDWLAKYKAPAFQTLAFDDDPAPAPDPGAAPDAPALTADDLVHPDPAQFAVPPVIVMNFTFPATDRPLVMQALARARETGADSTGAALVAMARTYLEAGGGD